MFNSGRSAARDVRKEKGPGKLWRLVPRPLRTDDPILPAELRTEKAGRHTATEPVVRRDAPVKASDIDPDYQGDYIPEWDGTQLTQSTQLNPREEPVDSGPGPVAPRHPAGPSHLLTEFHPSWGEMRGVVEKVRRTDGGYPSWRLPFELARALKKLPGANPLNMEPVCDEFCGQLGIDPFDGYFAFFACWDKVRSAGEDRWDAAVELAGKQPFRLDPAPPVKAAVLASVAVYLSAMNDPEPFAFPQPRMRKSFGWPKATASRVVASLVAAGVIEFADATWSYTEGRSRTCRLLARIVEGGAS